MTGGIVGEDLTSVKSCGSLVASDMPLVRDRGLMAIPDYQTLMLPVLRAAADGQERRIADVTDQLARDFALTEDERQQILPSGTRATFVNRIGWAKTYLAQAGLLESTKRGHFRITDRGRQVLAEAPSRIDNEFLSRFAEFVEFLERGRRPRADPSADIVEPPAAPPVAETPDELLRSIVMQIEAALKKELLERILAASPAFFEGLIVALLLAMGYGGSREEAGRIVGRSGDGGIDGVIDQDALGLDRVYVQAKRYVVENAVSEPEIEALARVGAAKANEHE